MINHAWMLIDPRFYRESGRSKAVGGRTGEKRVFDRDPGVGRAWKSGRTKAGKVEGMGIHGGRCFKSAVSSYPRCDDRWVFHGRHDCRPSGHPLSGNEARLVKRSPFLSQFPANFYGPLGGKPASRMESAGQIVGLFMEAAHHTKTTRVAVSPVSKDAQPGPSPGTDPDIDHSWKSG
ncbi:hypothetical protein CULT_760006 [[Clostridium] ultunense Esp]|nr:hypothetical protein CULT_760006 [[Clostridium] ultunense Esp]